MAKIDPENVTRLRQALPRLGEALGQLFRAAVRPLNSPYELPAEIRELPSSVNELARQVKALEDRAQATGGGNPPPPPPPPNPDPAETARLALLARHGLPAEAPWLQDERTFIPLEYRVAVGRWFVDQLPQDQGWISAETERKLQDPAKDYNLAWIRTAVAGNSLSRELKRVLGIAENRSLPRYLWQPANAAAKEIVTSSYINGHWSQEAFNQQFEEQITAIAATSEQDSTVGFDMVRRWVREAGAALLFAADPQPDLVGLDVVEEVVTEIDNNLREEGEVKAKATEVYRQRLITTINNTLEALDADWADLETDNQAVVTAFAVRQVSKYPLTKQAEANHELNSEIEDDSTELGQLATELETEQQT